MVPLDAAAFHPSWNLLEGTASTASPVRRPGEEFRAILHLKRGVPAMAIPGRFPEGRDAAIVITDHCDFDTVESTRKFLDEWLDRGLRITKGAFARLQPPTGRAAAATLQNVEYSQILRKLHEDGSEIAPHGLAESGQIAEEDYLITLQEFVSQWKPETWIDHGRSLNYCLSMGGDSEPYRLSDTLRRNGFIALWSYHDIPFLPISSLNMLSPDRARFLPTTRLVLREFVRGRPLIAAHHVRTAMRAADDVFAYKFLAWLMSLVRQIVFNGRSSRKSLKGIIELMQRRTHAGEQRSPHTRFELQQYAPTVYSKSCHPLPAGDLLLFATQEVNHLADVYTPSAVQRLVSERGLHIGHCYLTCPLPYINGLWQSPGSISSEWRRFLDALQREVSSGRLWNPTLGELARWTEAASAVEVIADSNAITLRNTSGSRVKGFTILVESGREIQGDWVTGMRDWEDWTAVWGDIPPKATVSLRLVEA
ncbi:MAG: hypothetical protein ACK47B_00465 [Armatimonadota bacterium]